ncbi:hypothetical protein Tco_0608372 [Tanacetum coccineum]
MLTKPQFFYDHTTKQALGFQKSFLSEESSAVGTKPYDGNGIRNTSAIVIPDSEETLMLTEESRSKMLLKQQDPMMLEKKVNTTPVDYAVLNQLSQDFETRFVPQTELSAEQVFWSQNSMNSSNPTPSIRPTKVEIPKELPKVSMVNTSLKNLKHHLTGFDVVVKERTTATAITEGLWGFKHTKACFRDEIIPFVKDLKDLVNTFNQFLIDELSEVQNVFHQMEQAVEQHRLESKTFEWVVQLLLKSPFVGFRLLSLGTLGFFDRLLQGLPFGFGSARLGSYDCIASIAGSVFMFHDVLESFLSSIACYYGDNWTCVSWFVDALRNWKFYVVFPGVKLNSSSLILV